MIPTLQRFYGYPGTAWEDMPMSLLGSYVEMMPRLHARELLDQDYVLDLALPPLPLAQNRKESAAWQKHYEAVNRERRRLEARADVGEIADRRRKRAEAGPTPVQLERLADFGFDVEER